MKVPHPVWPGSERLAPAWHQMHRTEHALHLSYQDACEETNDSVAGENSNSRYSSPNCKSVPIPPCFFLIQKKQQHGGYQACNERPVNSRE